MEVRFDAAHIAGQGLDRCDVDEGNGVFGYVMDVTHRMTGEGAEEAAGRAAGLQSSFNVPRPVRRSLSKECVGDSI